MLAGQRRPPADGGERVYQQLEIEHGPFRRVVSLGAEVDADAARARYENGLLIVELPIRPAPPAPSVPIRPARRAGPVIQVEAIDEAGQEVRDRRPGRAGGLPVLPLRDAVTFPDTLTPLAVGQERSIQLVNDVLAGNRMLAMVASRDPEAEAPGAEQLYRVGVVGTVARMLKVPDGTLRILVQGGRADPPRASSSPRSPTSSRT